MDAAQAHQIVFGAYKPVLRADVGFYRPSKEFLQHEEHVAVMNQETREMLALTGPVVPDEEAQNLRSLCQAVVYAGAFEMLELIKALAKGGMSNDMAEIEAKAILESLRHKMDGLEPGGVSPEGLKNCIMNKLGIFR